jgi:hypothetical protein
MSKTLTKKEKGFVHDFMDTGNGTRAVLNNYDTKDYDVASSIASQNLRKLKIQEALSEHAEPAESMIFKLSQKAKSEMVRYVSSKDIMDRAGYKPVDKSISQSLNVSIEARVEDKSGFEAIRDEYEEKLREKLVK